MSLFVLQLQMGLAVVGAQVLLPTAASRFLSWMARGVIAYPINIAYRFFFKALIASLVFVFLSQRAQTLAQLPPGALGQQLSALVVSLIFPLAFAVLFLKSDSIAAGLLQGVPGFQHGERPPDRGRGYRACHRRGRDGGGGRPSRGWGRWGGRCGPSRLRRRRINSAAPRRWADGWPNWREVCAA